MSSGTMFHALPFNCRVGSSLSVLLGWGKVFRLVPRCVVSWSVALCLRSLSLFGSFHQHFVPLGLTRLTFDVCIVVLVTDGLMPQARV